MSALSRALKELARPDEFKYDWYAWCKNQMSHAFIGFVLAIYLGLLASIALGLIKETADYVRDKKMRKDCLADAMFWSLGAWLIVNDGRIFITILIALGLIIGALPRLRRAGNET